MQSIYEGDVRFEHCYRLDLDPNIAPSHREACWQEWVTKYPWGQTQDRADYARQRLEQLRTRSDPNPTPLDPAADPMVPVLPAQQTAAPEPENVSAHRTPPPTAEAPPISADESATPEPVEDPPSQQCAVACRRTWVECSPAKKLPGEVTSESERAECNRAYARCMRRCFDE